MALSKILPASQEVQVTGKNLIINGEMQVAARGTSKTFTGNDNANYHTVDRWGQFLDFDEGSGSLSVTISQSTDVPAGQGFAYSLKGATTPSSFAKSGDDNLALFTYKVETYDATRLSWGASGAKSATLSYWIKSDTAGTGTLQIRLTDSSSVSGASDGNFYSKFTVNTANTWEYKTHVIPANTQDAWRNNVSNIAMHIHWYFGSNQSAAATQDAWFRVNNHGSPHSDNTYDFMNNAGEAYITGVQLELGDTATPFEHRSYGDELARCQRYFMQWNANNANREFVAMCTYFDDDDGHGIISTPVNMRTYPSISYNDLAVFKRGVVDTNSVIVNSTTAPIGDVNTVPFNMDNAGGLNAGEAFFVGFSSSTTGYIKLDAEL